MSPPRAAPRLALCLALATTLSLAIPAAAGAAGGASLISQVSAINATAGACADSTCDSDSSDDGNSVIGDWNGSASANANVPGAFGFGEGQQDTTVTQGGGTVSVSTESDIDFSVGGSASDKTVSGSASSTLDVGFQVAGSPVAYFVTGSFQEPADTSVRESVVELKCGGTTLVQVSSNTVQNFSKTGTISPGTTCQLNVEGQGSTTDAPNSDGGLNVGFGAEPVSCPEITVGNAIAQGCFTESPAGSGLFETRDKAWVGGFEIQPRTGGKLILDTVNRTLRQQGSVDVVFEGVRLPLTVGTLPVNVAGAAIALNQPGTVEKTLFELPVKGSATVAWASGGKGATFEAEIELEKLTGAVGRLVTLSPGETVAGLSGKLKASLQNGRGFLIDAAEVRIAKLNVLPRALNDGRTLGLRNILLRFERKNGKPFWTGQAGISFPLTRGELLGVTGKVFVFDRSLAGGGVLVEGFNRRIGGTPIFLQKLGGDLLFAPKFGYDLLVGGSFGPVVRGKQLQTIDGRMKGGELATADCKGGPYPTSMSFESKFTPLQGLTASGLVEAEVSGRSCYFPASPASGRALEVTLGAKIEFLSGALAYESTQTGFVSSNGANLEGSATLRVAGLPGDLSGQAIVSTKGLAACAKGIFFDVGFGYHWGKAPPSPFSGCDLAPYRVTAAISALRARAAARLRVPGGLPHAAFAATAAGGAPRLKVSGPGGFSLTTPAGNGTLRNRRVMVVPVAQERTTYVIVNDPRGGSWRVESAEAGRPLTRVRFARGLPKPRIKAKVRRVRAKKRGKRNRFQLRYTVRRIPGQRVIFMERGPGIAKRLGRARGRKGSITFKPTLATRRPRRIEAEVTQDGLPRALLTVARFKAPARPKLTRARIKAKRTKSSLALSWGSVPGAQRYLVEVRAGDRTLLGPLLTSKRTTRLKRTPAKGNLRVTVQALSTAQPRGPTARKTVKPFKKKTRKRKRRAK